MRFCLNGTIGTTDKLEYKFVKKSKGIPIGSHGRHLKPDKAGLSKSFNRSAHTRIAFGKDTWS